MDAIATTVSDAIPIGDDGVARKTGSDARSFSVETTQGGATSKFVTFDTFTGPFEPGSYQKIANLAIENTSDVEGTINVVIAELDSDGNVIREICRSSNSIGGGLRFVFEHDPNNGNGCTFSSSLDGNVFATMPDQSGTTVHFGIKTWGDGESEPSFPSPTAATAQLATGNPLDAATAFSSEVTGLPPEVIGAIGLGGAGLGVGFVLEEEFDIIPDIDL